MINLEKHREEIEKEITQLPIENCKKLLNLSGDKCIHAETCEECMHNFVDWLLEESKTDWSQVEPGTKCLVRDREDDEWLVREFCTFAYERPWFLGGAYSSKDIKEKTLLYSYTYRYCKLKEDEA